MVPPYREVIALIPARGGSTAIPHKNLRELAGRSLLARAVDTARASTAVTRVVVSTDDGEIAAAARDAGAEVPFMRPRELATDATPMLDVVAHALDHLGDDVEAVVLLQPTSPLRTSEHVDACVDVLCRTDADAVVTVVAVPHSMTPGSLLVLDDGWVAPYGTESSSLRRQEKPRLFARNGPAVLVTRPETIRAGSLYGARTAAVEMSKLASIDIDDAEDLVMAEALLTR